MKSLLCLLFCLCLASPAFAAFTERYVSVTGGGAHDGTSEANAWTLAEMIAAVPTAGQRVNIKAGSYSQGAATMAGGSAAANIVYRGYNSTIGDLDNQGRNADGTLNVTNFPVITVTGILVSSPWMFWQNISFTGALSSRLLGGTTNDDWGMISCKVINTQNNAAAQAVTGDDRVYIINCDLTCSGAAHGSVFETDVNTTVTDSRFKGTDSDTLITCHFGFFERNVFWGNSGNPGITFELSPTTFGHFIGNTFYNLTSAVVLPNAVNTITYIFKNNICTDSSKWIESLYSGTANVNVIEMNNRTRDVTTLLTGVESIQIGAVTTDGGGAETDYVDASTGNFRLISTSPAVGVGLTPYIDIGAYQRQASSGGQVSSAYAQ